MLQAMSHNRCLHVMQGRQLLTQTQRAPASRHGRTPEAVFGRSPPSLAQVVPGQKNLQCSPNGRHLFRTELGKAKHV